MTYRQLMAQLEKASREVESWSPEMKARIVPRYFPDEKLVWDADGFRRMEKEET